MAKYRVTLNRMVRECATVTVEADSAEQLGKQLDKIYDAEEVAVWEPDFDYLPEEARHWVNCQDVPDDALPDFILHDNGSVENRYYCQRCGCDRIDGFCTDDCCGFHDHRQDCPRGWFNHPEHWEGESPCTCGGRQANGD